MRSVWHIIRTQHRYDSFHFWLGILVALLPAAAGLLLLGVSGWFIAAAAIAGLSGAFLNIFAPSALIRAFAIVRTAGRYGERVLTHDATFRFLTGFRNRLFAAMALKTNDGQRSGLLLNRLTLDVAVLDTIYLRLVVPLVLSLVVAVSLLLVWSSVSPLLLLTGAAFVLAWLGLAVWTFARSDTKTARRSDAALDAMRLRAADLAAGRRDLAIYGGLEAAADSVLVADTRLAEAQDVEDHRTSKLTAGSTLLGQLFLAVMLLVCLHEVGNGALTAAFSVGLILVVMGLPEIFSMSLPGLSRLPRVALAAGRIMHLMRRPEEVEPSQSLSVPETGRQGAVPALALEDVSFGYPGADRRVLEGLSFHLAQGEILALAGRSGCGKSTIGALAARLRKPGQGKILLGGLEIDRISEKELRRKVTVIGQKAYLFNETVAENLRVANPDAGDTELWRALEQAALAERISENPKGLQTILGEGGLGLSGGEQRRLALARAFLTRPALFVLDEMTEGLDAATAADVLDRFLSYRGDAAVLMIAHRRQELERADRVLDLTAPCGSGIRSPEIILSEFQ
ncbi:thiol reductant ABC exporter subunit CydC [Roseibium aggregatum]|uniref:Putative ABC transporter ATP-binding protein n=1 Tax=Roseibium aggregatum TaxID=187304 RepID=A0A0M6XVP4_9HYPH|nr:thiol reductant ABC exporter subunit CydC [Roseibium aggregatum]CTQ41915.1 putative ABC transporter ATP-binding protein [Roseibium aggregatum]